MSFTEIDLGRTVLCDSCNTDFTDRPDTGGLIFESKGICPLCAPRLERSVKLYEEEHYIKARCPKDKSFADFIREFRGGNNKVRIYEL